MAVTARRSNGAAPDLAELAERVEQLEQMTTTTLRLLSRWIVRSTPGQAAATWAQMVTGELHIATHEEAAAVEAWLTARQ
jgi:hypothetical protein